MNANDSLTNDPILDELHAFRRAYAKRFDYDLKAICDDLKAKQAKRTNLVDLSGGEDGGLAAACRAANRDEALEGEIDAWQSLDDGMGE
uniref:Uncharacterized protein n=1 Tax=Candidatus Kentrum sp. LFY TaxID=2126342 RepID=A0A450V332_9GAMM|nr:MAG: hypothetical protein BECKLFY1418A_GA0070994_109410 [Candidatus Kentron sp. LFY]